MEQLAKAFVAFQAELTPVGKSATNPFFKSKYAPLHEVVALVTPLLAKHRLAVLQPMSVLPDGTPALKTILLHESGEKIEELTPLFLVKNDPQAHGSAVTYARRYGLMSITGMVADEDDDGHRATASVQKAPVVRDRAAEQKSGAEPMGEAPEDTLARAKRKILEELNQANYTTVDAKRAFIKGAIEKETIDSLNDCDAVMDALENES